MDRRAAFVLFLPCKSLKIDAALRNMKPILLYITADSQDEAEAVSRALVQEGLAACVNILGGIQSFYRWKGEVRQGAEVALIAKTRADLIASVTDRVKSLHNYTCPCVVALPIAGGNLDFLDWIAAETRDAT